MALISNAKEKAVRSWFKGILWIGCWIWFLALPLTAAAYDLLVAEDSVIRLNGWMQAGYAFTAPGDQPDTQGTYIGMARLKGAVTDSRWGRGIVQIEQREETMQLLDLLAEIRPVRGLALRFGKFKTFSSLEYLIPAPDHPFVNRALLVSLAQKRLTGVAIEMQRNLGWGKAALQGGWFDAPSDLSEELGDDDGKFLNLRGKLALSQGITLHAAYLDFLLATNETQAPSTDDGATGGDTQGEGEANPSRPLTYDRQLDAGFSYQQDGWTAFAEGMVVLDGPEKTTPVGLYLMALKSFPIDTFALEPGVRYDLLRDETQVWTHRVTTGLTWYVKGALLYATTNYELSFTEGTKGHALYLQVQAGF